MARNVSTPSTMMGGGVTTIVSITNFGCHPRGCPRGCGGLPRRVVLNDRATSAMDSHNICGFPIIHRTVGGCSSRRSSSCSIRRYN